MKRGKKIIFGYCYERASGIAQYMKSVRKYFIDESFSMNFRNRMEELENVKIPSSEATNILFFCFGFDLQINKLL